MSLRLTPRNLEAAYEYLRGTAPFNKWRLPEADEVEFHVRPLTEAMGDHLASWRGKPHRIRICSNRCGKTMDLITTMAHEMTHLYQRQTDIKRWSSGHGPKFKRLAARVCRAHGFDPKVF